MEVVNFPVVIFGLCIAWLLFVIYSLTSKRAKSGKFNTILFLLPKKINSLPHCLKGTQRFTVKISRHVTSEMVILIDLREMKFLCDINETQTVANRIMLVEYIKICVCFHKYFNVLFKILKQ